MAKTLISRFPNYFSFEEHLGSLGMFHMRLGMGRIQQARKRLKLTEPPLAQVVGTNGKGSTAFFLSQLAQAHGLKAGLYTSPHFLSFRERIRINGRCASPGQILNWANHVQEHTWDLGLTYFELLTLIAMYGFCQDGVDLAVLEAGLGGLNDATTAWNPEVLLFTPIGLDHEHIIGPGLEQIAQNKAGAIKARGTTIVGTQEPLVMDILRQEAQRQKARFLTVGDALAGFPEMSDAAPGLAGTHQVGNALLALAGWAELCAKRPWRLDPAQCRTALSSSSWPGRLQRITGPPEIILDGAHNLPALQTLAKALEALCIRPKALVFSCMRDKNLESMADCVRRLTSDVIIVPELPMVERARPARETAMLLGKNAQPVADVATALMRASRGGGPVLVCGSLYLLAEVYKKNPKWISDDVLDK